MYELVDGVDYPNTTNPIPLLDAHGNTQISKVTQIVITSMIDCSGQKACQILINSTQTAPSLTITATDPGYGLHRIDSLGYSIIDIEGWSNVSVENFTIIDDPGNLIGDTAEAPSASQFAVQVAQTNNSGVTKTLDSSGNVIRTSYTQYTQLYCESPDLNSSVSNPSLLQTVVGPDGATCTYPGYVVVQAATITTDGSGNITSTAPDTNYYDKSLACYIDSPNHSCPSTVSITSSKAANSPDVTDITLSGMTIDHSQSDAISVGGITGFYFKKNFISNTFQRSLSGGGYSNHIFDVGIEGNTFFASRGAAFNMWIDSSNPNRPSDVSNNTFDHNQHGDAFPCNGQEGCSGGQIGIAGGTLIFYRNTFTNSYMDAYDPDQFEETFGYDNFTGCDLSAQCVYNDDYGDITRAGILWYYSGGISSGNYAHSTLEHMHYVPDIEIANVLGNDVMLMNNRLDNGQDAITLDPTPPKNPVPVTVGQLQLYNNELAQLSDVDFNALTTISTLEPKQMEKPDTVFELGDCYTLGCGGANSATAPTIIAVGPTTAAAERANCKLTNCLWVTATEAWAPDYNSVALGTGGSPVQCALQIYGPGGGTLLATVQGDDATCTTDEGVFTIPASVAQHQTTVQIAFKNLDTQLSSAKQLVSLVGMTPTITGAATTTCSGSPCAWITATDAAAGRGNCAVGIYTTSGTLITTLTGTAVTCSSTEATFFIPASILANYTAVDVNYQNLVQGTWSTLSKLTLPATGGGGGGGGGGGTNPGCGGAACKQQ
ncbi:MAG TPA: hypothetical protein VGH91_05570 [Gammaproteobacteria bacterium]